MAKEIESWKDFKYALREEDALLFRKMLSECRHNKDYIRDATAKVKAIQPNPMALGVNHMKTSWVADDIGLNK